MNRPIQLCTCPFLPPPRVKLSKPRPVGISSTVGKQLAQEVRKKLARPGKPRPSSPPPKPRKPAPEPLAAVLSRKVGSALKNALAAKRAAYEAELSAHLSPELRGKIVRTKRFTGGISHLLDSRGKPVAVMHNGRIISARRR